MRQSRRPEAVSGKIRFYGHRDFMPHILSLRGRNALSEFRLSKLQQSFRQAGYELAGINATFWHFVSAARALTAAENAILERILTYGPAAGSSAGSGQLLLV